jgi:hypothetical protein
VTDAENLRQAIERSAIEQALKTKKINKIKTQGKNDSFFAGEEYRDFEEMNPNVEMGF